MDKATGAERQPLANPDWAAGYWPRTLEEATWKTVRPFVEGCAARIRLDHHNRRAALGLLARLAGWAAGEGLPLKVEVVLDPDTVERFITTTIAHDRSASTYRSLLRRIGLQLTRKAPWEARPAVIARRTVAPPYTAAEVEQLWSDALSQSTRRRARAARALIALGAGAGLDGRWVHKVAATNIARRYGAVLVSVGSPAARAVPVLAGWEDEILELAAGAGYQFLVGGRSLARNRVWDLVDSIVIPDGHAPLSPARLRSTWLVTHLTIGTRLPELAEAAGLRGATVLSDLLSYVPALDEAAAAAMLRGRS